MIRGIFRPADLRLLSGGGIQASGDRFHNFRFLQRIDEPVRRLRLLKHNLHVVPASIDRPSSPMDVPDQLINAFFRSILLEKHPERERRARSFPLSFGRLRLGTRLS